MKCEVIEGMPNNGKPIYPAGSIPVSEMKDGEFGEIACGACNYIGMVVAVLGNRLVLLDDSNYWDDYEECSEDFRVFLFTLPFTLRFTD
jgi:hypothetical protein